MKDLLVSRGVDEAKISVLLNWHAGETEESHDEVLNPRLSDEIRCVYAGNIGMMQDVETVIRAAAEVQHELPLQVSIYGSGVAEGAAQDLAAELGVQNVKFMGRVSAEQMQDVYSKSDFQLVTLKDRDVFRVTIPSKFQAAISKGVPVITTVPGDLAALCAANDIGLVAEPENPGSLARAFRDAAKMGMRGHAAMALRAHQFYWTTMSADKAREFIINQLEMAAGVYVGGKAGGY
jgi:glycosyltransferase involved in cell wall biosynthesis